MGHSLSARSCTRSASTPRSGPPHTDALQPSMCRSGRRLQGMEVWAVVVAGQVQLLAAKPPVLLDLCLSLCRPSGQPAVRVAGLGDPLYGSLECRVLHLQVHAEPRTEVR